MTDYLKDGEVDESATCVLVLDIISLDTHKTMLVSYTIKTELRIIWTAELFYTTRGGDIVRD